MNTERKQLTLDSFVSCLGLVLFVLFAGAALWIFLFWQIVPWLREAVWHSYPMQTYFAPKTRWLGLQIIMEWIYALPVTLVLALVGILLFWAFGLVSAKLYQLTSRRAGKTVTPDQTRA